jgi:hypothetical protein
VTLLSDLIEDASGDNVPLAVLLRRVKVLAARLRTGPLANWVDHELAGYGSEAELPSYRGPFDAAAVGHFAGPFNSEIRNAPIPTVSFEENVRSTFAPFFTVEFRQGVATLEDIVDRSASTGGTDSLHVAWPADAVAYANQLWQQGKVQWYEGMGLISAWTPISAGQITGVLDTVRTRVLDLALAVEAEDPTAGERVSSAIAPERATNIFNTVVMGGNLAIQSVNVTQTMPPPATEAELFQRLTELGMAPELVSELEEALQADRDSGEATPTEPGSKVKAWLGKATMLAAKAGSGVAVGASGDVVAQLVMGLFGGR